MEKIKCVLLVDDSPSTNFYHKKIIETTNKVDQIFEVENGLEALDYLLHKGSYNHKPPRPNIIFLDINMPKMDGFEFLEKYNKIPKKYKADVIVVFLTTSNWNKDKLKAFDNDLVHDYIEKPLTKEGFEKISKYYERKQTCLH